MNIDLIFELLFGFAFVFGGLLFLFGTWKDYKLAKKSKSWQQTTGTILKSEVVSSISGSGRRTRTVYHPEIHYKYNVDKQEYHSSQIFIGSIGKVKSQSYANKYVSKYPVGKQLMIHYSPHIYQLPDKDKYSVLETGVNSTVYTSGLVSVICAVGGGAFLITQYAEHGIATTIAGVVLGVWIGTSSSLLKLRKNYNLSRVRSRTSGDIPGVDGFAVGKSHRLMDIFVKAGDSFLSKRRWRAKVK